MPLGDTVPPPPVPSRGRLASVGALTLLAILAIGWLDVITGPDIGMSLLYLLPVAGAAWWSGTRGAVLTALTASAAWFAADLASRPVPLVGVSLWNGATRLFIFLALGALLARVRRDQRTLQVLLEREQALARTDSLTGLANLRAFQLAVETEIARAQRRGHPLCLMYLDVDNFKRVNDRFGHAAGDEALVAIANTLRGAVRATDVLARLGGDEFAVLMWQVDESEVATLAQRIVDRVSRLATDYPGSELGMTAGAAYFSVPPANAAHAIRVADETMYQGKRGGKGRVCVAIHPPDHEAPPTSDDRRDSREIAI